MNFSWQQSGCMAAKRIEARRLGAVAFLIAALASPALAQQSGGAKTTAVGVTELAIEDVPFVVTLPGRAVAFEETDIRPRVNGVVSSIDFDGGHLVKKGDPLFHLEDDTYQAELSAAQAEKASAEANVAAAQAQVNRYKKLEQTSVSVSDFESAGVALAQAHAALLTAEASLQAAELDLDRTLIRAPIDGYPSVATVSVGSLVTANQTDALTTITRLDPIYVDVSESSARMMRVRAQIGEGSMDRSPSLKVQLTLENGQEYDGMGTMVSPGATVSTTTGTVDFRFRFDNPERKILPGQFLRASITLGSTRAILVPQIATSRGSDGLLTAFIADQGKARKVTLSYSGTYQNAWIVTGGVEPGQQLILDGLKNLRDGAAIKTVPVTIDAAGLVTEVTDAAAQTPKSE